MPPLKLGKRQKKKALGIVRELSFLELKEKILAQIWNGTKTIAYNNEELIRKIEEFCEGVLEEDGD